jgi:hypothetical protein
MEWGRHPGVGVAELPPIPLLLRGLAAEQSRPPVLPALVPLGASLRE